MCVGVCRCVCGCGRVDQVVWMLYVIVASANNNKYVVLNEKINMFSMLCQFSPTVWKFYYFKIGTNMHTHTHTHTHRTTHTQTHIHTRQNFSVIWTSSRKRVLKLKSREVMTHIDMSQSAKSYFRGRRNDPFPFSILYRFYLIKMYFSMLKTYA